MTLRLFLVITALLVTAGCSDPAVPSTAPSPPVSGSSRSTPAGSWSGSITDAVSGAGTLQLTLAEQSSGSLAGTWSVVFKNGSRLQGPAAAALFRRDEYGVILYVDPQPECSADGDSDLLGFTFVNLLVASNRLTATSARTSCGGSNFGAVDLRRQ
jgi:hypothetical protein